MVKKTQHICDICNKPIEYYHYVLPITCVRYGEKRAKKQKLEICGWCWGRFNQILQEDDLIYDLHKLKGDVKHIEKKQRINTTGCFDYIKRHILSMELSIYILLFIGGIGVGVSL